MDLRRWHAPTAKKRGRDLIALSIPGSWKYRFHIKQCWFFRCTSFIEWSRVSPDSCDFLQRPPSYDLLRLVIIEFSLGLVLTPPPWDLTALEGQSFRFIRLKSHLAGNNHWTKEWHSVSRPSMFHIYCIFQVIIIVTFFSVVRLTICIIKWVLVSLYSASR